MHPPSFKVCIYNPIEFQALFVGRPSLGRHPSALSLLYYDSTGGTVPPYLLVAVGWLPLLVAASEVRSRARL